MLFLKLQSAILKVFNSSVSLTMQIGKLHTSAFRYAEIKNCLQSIPFEDMRLQKHLKFLQNQYLSTQYDEAYNHESLKNIYSLIQDIDVLNTESKELDTFISELKGKDDELLVIAQTEKADLEMKLSSLKSAVLYHLIPDEIIDDKDIIMELAPGVGGQEAMLFNKDMFEMYCKFAQWKGWNYDVLKYDGTDIGGLRNGHIAVSGKNAYKILKYECGVHRVQRVPQTDRYGRVHTSTMTVAVLPQPSDIDIVIHPKDIELEYKHSSGAGGQHVNTTLSCVRIHHKPTGIVAESQMERNAHKNKELAMKSLRAKLYERELTSMIKETTLNRKLQIGTAARSEKVRTYNFSQDRITDHRAHVNMHNIELFFNGGELLNEMLDNLQAWNSLRVVMEILQKYES